MLKSIVVSARVKEDKYFLIRKYVEKNGMTITELLNLYFQDIYRIAANEINESDSPPV